MKTQTFGLLLCFISLSSLADSMCGPDAWFVPETSECHHPTLGRWHAGSPRPNQQHQPRDYYGAIAADVVNGKSDGHAFNHRSSNAAEIAALNFCGLKECQIIISNKNTCAATAVPLYTPDVQGLIYGTIGETPEAANLNAISKCKEANSNVRCVIWTKAACSYRE